MKLYQILLAALPGTVVGLIVSWQFVFASLIPWLALPAGWANLAGLLAYFLFFAEIGAGVGAILGVILMALLGLLLGKLSHADFRRFSDKFRQLRSRLFRSSRK